MADILMDEDWNARGDEADTTRLRDWLETQVRVMSFWVDELTERQNADMLSQVSAHRDWLTDMLHQQSAKA